MTEDMDLDLEFAISELEPRDAPSPGALVGSGGSGGFAHFGSGGSGT